MSVIQVIYENFKAVEAHLFSDDSLHAQIGLTRATTLRRHIYVPMLTSGDLTTHDTTADVI